MVNGTRYLGQYVYDNYVPSIESTKEKLSDAFDAVGNGLRNTYSVMPSVEFAKGTLTSVESGVKSAYDTSVEYTKGALNSVRSSLYSRIYGTKVPSPEKQFKREDGSKPSM